MINDSCQYLIVDLQEVQYYSTTSTPSILLSPPYALGCKVIWARRSANESSITCHLIFRISAPSAIFLAATIHYLRMHACKYPV